MASPSISPAAVAEVVRAHQEALDEADRVLEQGSIQHRILHSMVTASAANVATWLATRVPDGEALAPPLDELATRLRPGDTAGRAIRQAEVWLASQLQQVVFWAVLGAKAPLSLIGLGALVIGGLGFAVDAGFAVGYALTAGTIPSYAIVQGLRLARASAPRELPEFSELFPDPAARAEAIYVERVRPAVIAIYASRGAAPGSTPLVGKVRFATNAALLLFYAFIVVTLVLALVGVGAGYNEYQRSRGVYL